MPYNPPELRVLYSPPRIPAGIRAIPGIPRNGILAVLPAKIVNSMPGILTDSGMAQESPERNHWNGIGRNGIRGIFFNSNSNY